MNFSLVSHFQSFILLIAYMHNNGRTPVLIPVRSTVSDILCDISLIKPFPIHTFDSITTYPPFLFLSPPFFPNYLFLCLQTSYLSMFRQVYTVGYATSLISLITAIVVFTAFRWDQNSMYCPRHTLTQRAIRQNNQDAPSPEIFV